MPAVFNLLSNNDALLFYDDTGKQVLLGQLVTSWTAVSGATTLTTELTSTNFAVSSRYVLVVYPNNTNPITIKLEDVPLYINDNNRLLSFNCKLKCDSQMTIFCKLYIDENSNITANQQELTSGQYNAVQSNSILVDDDEDNHLANIEILISGHSQKPIFFTTPHLIHDLGFLNNPIIGLTRRYLPDFYWELDSQASSPSFPFFKFLDALSHAAGDTRLEYGAMYGFEISQLQNPEWIPEYWTKSSFVSPSRVRDEYIPWLSLFTGERIVQNIQDNDGEFYFNNSFLSRDFIEWQLRTRKYGNSGGTRESIIDSAGQVLIKTKDGELPTRVVALTPNFGGDPFAIQIKTLTNETFDVDDFGKSSPMVLKAIEKSRPMGYSVKHITEDVFLFTLDDISLGVLGAGFPLDE